MFRAVWLCRYGCASAGAVRWMALGVYVLVGLHRFHRARAQVSAFLCGLNALAPILQTATEA